MSDHEIQKMLVLSTCHVTEKTAKAMEEKSVESSLPYDFGFFVHVPTHARDIPANTPSDLEFLLGYGRGLGCDWIRLDNAGPERDDLPKWDW